MIMKAKPEIKDGYYRFTQGAFYMMGILIFLPHQFFSTCTDYWMYRFRNPRIPPPPGPRVGGPPPQPPGLSPLGLSVLGLSPLGPPTPLNHRPPHKHWNHSDFDFHHYDIPRQRNPFQAQITASFNISNAASMTISLLVLILLKDKLPCAQTRIKVALISILVLFVGNTFLIWANESGDRHLFFTIIMILCGLLNHCSALTVMSLYEMITKFPIHYYFAISSGSALNGCLSALIQIIALSFHLKPSDVGAIHFLTACIIIVFTMVAYWHLERNSKYFIYRIQNGLPQVNTPCNYKTLKAMVISVVKKMKYYYLSLVIITGTSTIVFPGFLVLVISTEKNINGSIVNRFADLYFTPVVTFFGYYASNFIGRELARIIRMPKNWSYVILGSILRMSFIVLFAFCNSMPRKNTPVVFGDDAYIALVVLFGLSEGILINLSFLAVPTVANEEELEIAVALVPLFIFATEFVCGILSAMLISLV